MMLLMIIPWQLKLPFARLHIFAYLTEVLKSVKHSLTPHTAYIFIDLVRPLWTFMQIIYKVNCQCFQKQF